MPLGSLLLLLTYSYLSLTHPAPEMNFDVVWHQLLSLSISSLVLHNFLALTPTSEVLLITFDLCPVHSCPARVGESFYHPTHEITQSPLLRSVFPAAALVTPALVPTPSVHSGDPGLGFPWRMRRSTAYPALANGDQRVSGS